MAICVSNVHEIKMMQIVNLEKDYPDTAKEILSLMEQNLVELMRIEIPDFYIGKTITIFKPF